MLKDDVVSASYKAEFSNSDLSRTEMFWELGSSLNNETQWSSY